MNKIFWSLLFSGSLLLAPCVFAQDSDQSSTDSGVLVSSSTHKEVLDQDGFSDQGRSNNSENHQHHNTARDASFQDSSTNSSDSNKILNSLTDDIVNKSTSLIMSQITENMKLTQDQISAAQLIIKDNIVRVRDLQLSLKKGDIDAKAMYNQREQANNEENQRLSLIFTSDQMKVWINLQNE